MLWRQQVFPGDCIHPGSLSWFIRALSGRGGWAQRNKCSFFTASKSGTFVFTGNRWYKKVKICFISQSKWPQEMNMVYMQSDLESHLHINAESLVFGHRTDKPASINTDPQCHQDAAVPSGKITKQREGRWKGGVDRGCWHEFWLG